jgi:hypothetical protein
LSFLLVGFKFRIAASLMAILRHPLSREIPLAETPIKKVNVKGFTPRILNQPAL